MAKYCGVIGYACQEETAPSVYETRIIEHPYTGDILENVRRWEAGTNLNDDLNIANTISILADDYAYSNIYNAVYVTFMGGKWKVRSIELSYPRIILSIGGVYNDRNDSDDC